jgi:hypothetical protein
MRILSTVVTSLITQDKSFVFGHIYGTQTRKPRSQRTDDRFWVDPGVNTRTGLWGPERASVEALQRCRTVRQTIGE